MFRLERNVDFLSLAVKLRNNKTIEIFYRDLDRDTRIIVISKSEIIIDKEDFDRIISMGFHRSGPDRAGNYYFEHTFYENQKRIGSVKLHRFLMNAPDGVFVDHQNGNTLDNRKANLRLCTQAENTRNQKLNKRSSTGFKGVRFLQHIGSRGKQYQARIRYEGKLINLGVFETAEEAHQAYCKASAKYHGEFGRVK
jgi:hypothetical protein